MNLLTGPITVDVPWPSRMLSPNGRANPFALARVKRLAKSFAATATREAIAGRAVAYPVGVRLRYDIVTRPKCRRNRDDDNTVAMLKASLDGIAQALGVDDSQFQLGSVTEGEKSTRPHVLITLTPAVQIVEIRGEIS